MKPSVVDPTNPLATEPAEVLDIGPLTKMLQEKVPEVIDLKSKEAKIKVDLAEMQRKHLFLIEDRTFMSRLAEQACCYDDMLEYLTELLDEKTTDFTIEERNLFSVAFKNLIEQER